MSFILKAWELISRFARVLVEIDDALLEAKAFYDWLVKDEEEE